MGKSYLKQEVVIARNANGAANATSQKFDSISTADILLISLIVLVSAGIIYRCMNYTTIFNKINTVLIV